MCSSYMVEHEWLSATVRQVNMNAQHLIMEMLTCFVKLRKMRQYGALEHPASNAIEHVALGWALEGEHASVGP